MSLTSNVEREVVKRKGEILIRTKQMKVGIAKYWSKDDVAHIWVDDEMFRVTSKGTLIKVEEEGP